MLREGLGRRGLGGLVLAERARNIALDRQRDGHALPVADRPGHRSDASITAARRA